MTHIIRQKENLVFIFVLLFLLGIFTVIGVWQRHKTEALLSATEELVLKQAELEAHLGYGGLIHNLKNAVLRPTETNYLTRAQQHLEQAQLSLNTLQQGLERHNIAVSLEGTSEMIAAYGQRIRDTKTLITQGMKPQEIDASIRYDDRPALEELTLLRTVIADFTSSSVRQIQRLAQIFSLLSVITVTVPFFVLLILQNRARLRRVEALSQANALLEQRTSALERANAALVQFSSIVSHDLKSPVRHIQIYSEIAQEDDLSDEERINALSKIDESTGELQHILTTLLQFTKSAFSIPTPLPMELTPLIERQFKLLTDRISPDASLEISELPEVSADADLMERVVSNLLSNSLKYTQNNCPAKIKVSGETKDAVHIIRFSDNGIGINPAQKDLIFRPFKRLPSAQAHEGDGIGLSIVKTILEAHGGSIELEGKGDLGGAQFKITLPVVPASEALAERNFEHAAFSVQTV